MIDVNISIAAIVVVNLIKNDIVVYLVRKIIHTQDIFTYDHCKIMLDHLVDIGNQELRDAILSHPKTLPLLITMLHHNEPHTQVLGSSTVRKLLLTDIDQFFRKYKYTLLKNEHFLNDMKIISEYPNLHPAIQKDLKRFIAFQEENMKDSSIAYFDMLNPLVASTLLLGFIGAITRFKITRLIGNQWSFSDFPKLQKVVSRNVVAVTIPLLIVHQFVRMRTTQTTIIEQYQSFKTDAQKLEFCQEYHAKFARSHLALRCCYLLAPVVTFTPILYSFYIATLSFTEVLAQRPLYASYFPEREKRA